MDQSVAIPSPRRSAGCKLFEIQDYEVAGFGGTIGHKLYLSSLAGVDTDVDFQCGNDSTQVVHGHLAILKSESRVFKVMLDERWKSKTEEEEKLGKILQVLPVDDFEDFKSFMKLLYGFQHLQRRDFSWVIPGWKLADKYEAERVLAVCDTYFKTLARHVGKSDVCKVLSVARSYECSVLEEAALNHIKMNLHHYWQKEKKDWLQWDEKTVIELLATNSQKILEEKKRIKFDWSQNECGLLSFAVEWIENQSKNATLKDEDEPTEAKSARVVDSALALRVLKNIRFCQIEKDELGTCMMKLMGLLSAEHIGQIYLIHSGTSRANFTAAYGEEKDFVVDERLRSAPKSEPQDFALVASQLTVDADDSSPSLD